MAETIETLPGGVVVWKWYNVSEDLEGQGGLSGVVINPFSITEASCEGIVGNNPFCITWVFECFLLLSSQIYSQPLIDAFAKVVGYKPFCHYQCEGFVTIEWNKVDPATRIAELQTNPEITELVLL